jgi:hypothetical protein
MTFDKEATCSGVSIYVVPVVIYTFAGHVPPLPRVYTTRNNADFAHNKLVGNIDQSKSVPVPVYWLSLSLSNVAP